MAKSKYETEVLPRLNEIKNWVLAGATDKEVMERLGIKNTAFYLYKGKHAEFAETLKKTKAIADAEVVGALYKRAMGYEVEEWEEVYNGAGELVSKKVKKRHIPPDPTSMNFWLVHRQRSEWGAMVEATDGDTGGVVMISERDIVDEGERG